jgi:spoIIIJ-associated protein
MAEETIYEGRDLEEALAAASEALGISGDDLHYEMLEQGRRGVFGLGAKCVRIRVTSQGLRAAPAAEGQQRTVEFPELEPESEEAPPEAAEVEASLAKMIELMGLDLSLQSTPIRGGINIQLQGPDRKLLTDRNAELLWSFQVLLVRMARRAWPELGRIQLSCEGQARRRDEDLIGRVRHVAQQVAQSGRTQKLQPLNAYERRLVHITVREFGGLTSCSEGDGSMKRVRISKVQNLGVRS